MLKTILPLTILAWSVLGGLPPAARAETRDFRAALETLNRTPAMNSPQFKTWDEIFALRVIDGNRQLVGAVEDVRVNADGSLTALVTRIRNVGRREKLVESAAEAVVFHKDISAFEIPFAPGGAVPVDEKDLSDVSPAAGGGLLYSLRAMKGTELRDTGGRWLGSVKSVLLDSGAAGIQALVLQDVPGADRYRDIAIPFDPARLTVNPRFGHIQFRLTPEAAQDLTEYAKGLR